MNEDHPTGATVSTDEARSESSDWWVYHGTGDVMSVAERDRLWPAPPPWRRFSGTPDLPVPKLDPLEAQRRLGRFAQTRTTDRQILGRVNVALALARPLLITGQSGCGKSTLAYAVARELSLGDVLRWSVTSHTSLISGLFSYDAIERAQAVARQEDRDIGNFVHLGPLGTSLLPHALPRVLLIKDIDRGSFDFLYDLSVVLDEGAFTIPELTRVRDREPQVSVHTADIGGRAPVVDGVVRCHAFPFIVITSSSERDLPSWFLRKCVIISFPNPDVKRQTAMVAAHFPSEWQEVAEQLVNLFSNPPVNRGVIPADQLLNAVHVIRSAMELDREKWDELLDAVWHEEPEGL